MESEFSDDPQACWDDMMDQFAKVRATTITPLDWEVWSGAFCRHIRTKLRGKASKESALFGCLFSIWQSLERLRKLPITHQMKIRQERRHLEELKKLYLDIQNDKVGCLKPGLLKPNLTTESLAALLRSNNKKGKLIRRNK